MPTALDISYVLLGHEFNAKAVAMLQQGVTHEEEKKF